ncbi:uncharacterized protein F5147DRAFT_780950 [Suillus discolor]|uniref:Uncharacterized protein n=1 Tax=Suillus discolor TaxID=1912936 RepID=A0A9P7JMH9_9AGAM|nr:uncharacterized protein F5147DRAFT_780950 [Suillus discolor]KAG2088557.1 hypothetical protein F5147DRAFT_780950 [Suillus discolor]
MVRKANNGSGRQRVGSCFSKVTGGVGGSGGTGDYAQLVVGRSDESDYAKEQRRVRAAGKRKAREDLDPEDNPSQLTYARPSNMPSHISLGAPVTRKTTKDLTPTFLVDARVQVKRPNFIRWFLATFPYQCSTCVTKKVSCELPPVTDGAQRKFKCTACRDDCNVICSWFQDLLEVYIREAYQLDVGEARVLASSKGNDPQGTLRGYYQTWLAEHAERCSDGELREDLKALETIISFQGPKLSSRVSPTQRDPLQPASVQRASTQLHPPERQHRPQKWVNFVTPLPPEELPPAQAFPSSPATQCPSMPSSVQISPGMSQLPPTIPDRASPTPLPPFWSLSTPTSVQISPGGSRLPPTTPDRASLPTPLSTPAPVHIPPGCRKPFSPLLPTSPGPRELTPLASSTLVPANFSPPIIVPATIATSETHGNTSQNNSPAQMDDVHAASQHRPGDDLTNAEPRSVNVGTDEACDRMDPRPPSVGLKSEMANLSDGLAKLAVGDPSFPPEFSNRRETEAYLLKMLQGSLQTCDFLGSVVDEQDSRHVAVTRSLEDEVRLLTLENGELKQGVAMKCLEQKICLLEVENDKLRGRLARQDQELEDRGLRGRAVRDLEQKVRQLEVGGGRLQGQLSQREQIVATMKTRAQLAGRVLWLASQRAPLAPGNTQAPDPVADNLRGLVSMIDAHVDGIQPALANKRLGGSNEDG